MTGSRVEGAIGLDVDPDQGCPLLNSSVDNLGSVFIITITMVNGDHDNQGDYDHDNHNQ